MAETNYPPEPWREHAAGEEGAGAVRDRDGVLVCRVTPPTVACFPETERRIVACVNACRWIPTVDLEAGELSVAFDLIASALVEYGARMPESWRIQARATLRALGREV